MMSRTGMTKNKLIYTFKRHLTLQSVIYFNVYNKEVFKYYISALGGLGGLTKLADATYDPSGVQKKNAYS